MKNAFFIEDWLEEKFNEGLIEGKLIGIKQGQEMWIQEGEQIGILKGKCASISQVLIHRFNPDARTLRKIEKQLTLIDDVDQLDDLLEKILQVEELQTFVQALHILLQKEEANGH